MEAELCNLGVLYRVLRQCSVTWVLYRVSRQSPVTWVPMLLDLSDFTSLGFEINFYYIWVQSVLVGRGHFRDLGVDR